MRELKFRAWDESLREMISWEDMLDDFEFKHIILNQLSNVCPVEQFVGLLDCKGKEIYEGDIVKFIDDTTIPNSPTECITDVFWWDVMACFSLRNTFHELNFMTCPHMEVIGNIHQNPELLYERSKR